MPQMQVRQQVEQVSTRSINPCDETFRINSDRNWRIIYFLKFSGIFLNFKVLDLKAFFWSSVYFSSLSTD